ncbi:putative CAAX prenyl protease 2 [Podospora australis]|uniref:intramembrane prenyl-peptidase Rce1 n=1 Tax=Podospora australis TaxID=1536484 RepID=A0AAN6WW18_9PEZI|nr:putative CAAX prenyl protease 2 [Podospora australis]
MPALGDLGDLLHKFNPWHKDEHPPPPPISPSTAYSLLALYALIYFIPFYLSPLTRPSPTLSRDSPSVIRARIRSVSLSCLLCAGATWLVLTRTAHATPSQALHLLGLYPVGLSATLRCSTLTALLFLGPLYSYFIIERGYRDWLRLAPIKEAFTEWITYRNILAGPITEEILFRSTSIPLMLLAQCPLPKIIFLSPIIFGLAHIHHFYEFRLTHPQVPASAALLRSVFQLGYTTLFGAYATFLFLRSGSLLAVCAVHAFCNCMGLPQIWGRLGFEEEELGGKKRNIGWTVAYYILLVAGAWGWWRGLWVLSECSNGLVSSEAF